MHPDIQTYHDKLEPADRQICDVLAHEISKHLSGAESKVWHGHPVWFIEGNPIVGYSKQKAGVQLLFWSGQSFDEVGLENEGSFKAAQRRYMDVSEIDTAELARWLQKSKDIQWNYKNIVKRKGKLERL